jgi:HEAT repeat protein
MWQLAPLPRKLDAAIRDLGDAKAKVRASAIGDLSRFSEGEQRDTVIRELLRMLRDEDGEVRAQAATALGDAAATEAVMPLLVMIEDDHPLARQLAVEALGAIGDGRAAARLRRALDDDRAEIRFQAVIALPRVDPDDAERALAEATKDEDKAIRYIALRVAEERISTHRFALGEVLATAAIEKLTDEEPEVRVAAALVLAAAGRDEGRSVLLAVVDDRLKTPEAEDEAAALEAAGKLGLEDARLGLSRRAWGVGRLLRERHGVHARIALALMGDSRARAEIVADLEAWSLLRRTAAAMSVGRVKLVEARAKLEAMRGRPDRADPNVVEEALHALDA